MFCIPGIVGLLVFVYTRPQEYFEGLQRIPFLYLFFGLALFGFVVDMKLRLLKPVAVPSLLWTILFWIWCVISVGIKAVPGTQIQLIIQITLLFILYFVIAHGVQSFRSLRIVTLTLIGIGMFLTIVAVHQGATPTRCIMADEANPGEGWPEDRECEQALDCYGEGAEPGATYMCEHVGMMGTFSIELRVRYRGELHDPNELSLAVCIVLPFIFAMVARRKSAGWKLFAVIGTLGIMVMVIMSQSRGGQLVFVAVLGVYAIKRLGAKGIVLGMVLALPLMLLGGRSGSKADASAQLRYEAWRGGLQMVKHNPIGGVGMRQFGEHFFMTAHNSYILTPAELGFPGMFLWTVLIYLAIKGAWVGTRRFADVPGAEAGRVWGLALLACWAGLLIQMMFLSFAYHSVLWVYFGVSGAYYSAVKSHVPDFHVPFGLKDAAICFALDVAYVMFILPAFLIWKGY